MAAVAKTILDYASVAVMNPALWQNWFPVDDLANESLGLTLPVVQGMHIPEMPTFGFNPFVMRANGTTFSKQTTWVLQRSFAMYSEARLESQQYSLQAAKMLTYLKLCLVMNGCASKTEYMPGVEIILTGPTCSAKMDGVPLDQKALALANQAWPMVVLTVMTAFADVGGQFTDATVNRCESDWMKTPWPKALEEHDIEWPHLFNYVVRCFSPRALLVALTHKVLSGGLHSAPIFDVVSYTIERKCALPMISPWGPESAAAWWRCTQHHLHRGILSHRSALKTVIEDLGPGALHDRVVDWATSTAHPYLDSLRIMAPTILSLMRTMYMPSLQSHLYLDANVDAERIMRHARDFAFMSVDQGFDQDGIQNCPIPKSELEDVGDFKSLLAHAVTTGLPRSDNSGFAVDTLLALLDGSISDTDSADTSAASDNSANGSSPIPSPTLVEETKNAELATQRHTAFDAAIDRAMSGYYGLEVTREEFVRIVQQPDRHRRMNRLIRPQLEKAVAEFKRIMEASQG